MDWSFVIVPVLFVAYAIYRVVSRGLALKQILADGVETTGTVVRKVKFRSGASTYLRYEYRDPTGRRYAHKSLVPDEIWNAFETGSPFPVVYSRSKPHLSAPKYLVEQCREAMQKKAVKGA